MDTDTPLLKEHARCDRMPGLTAGAGRGSCFLQTIILHRRREYASQHRRRELLGSSMQLCSWNPSGTSSPEALTPAKFLQDP